MKPESQSLETFNWIYERISAVDWDQQSSTKFTHFTDADQSRHLWLTQENRVFTIYYFDRVLRRLNSLHVADLLMNEPDEAWICDTDPVSFRLDWGDTFHGLDSLDEYDIPTPIRELPLVGNYPADDPKWFPWFYFRLEMTDYAS